MGLPALPGWFNVDMSRSRTKLAGLSVALVAALSLATAAEAHHDLRVSPKSGGTRTVFKLRFTADLSEAGKPDRKREFYVASIRGPRGCAKVAGFLDGKARKGKRVTMRLTPALSVFPLLERKRWCPGRYRGSVVFCHCGEGDSRPDVRVGRFSFRVRRRS